MDFSIQKLFETPTIGLISWNLIVFKELTVKQLARLVKKNVSTVSRHLNKMREANLVVISKTELVQNLQLNYWRINPEFTTKNLSAEEEDLQKALEDDPREFLRQVATVFTVIQGIMNTTITYKIASISTRIQQQGLEKALGIFSYLIFDKELGKLFYTRLSEFIESFCREQNVSSIPLEKLGLESYIFFLFGSQVSDAVPSLDD